MLSTSTHRSCAEASCTVIGVPESSAARAAFVDLPLTSGGLPPAAVGSMSSRAGQVSPGSTDPKSSAVSVGTGVPAGTFWEHAFQFRSRACTGPWPGASCDSGSVWR
ncbi:hypothetical protein [Streptomyces sp. NPDC093260]|uniref:hypothetical protein n=1 Tax=Streptomyces sp. NPDC093260 TaxID=3155073 RepID=UPI00341F5952